MEEHAIIEGTKIFEYLEKIAPLIPIPLYWLDAKGVFLGGNDLCLTVTGAKSLDMFIGKTYDQIHPKGIAEKLVENINSVIRAGKTIETEEVTKDFATGEFRYFIAFRSPLYDGNTVVGVIATSIEVTDKKKAEHLTLENEKQKIELADQAKFRKTANQVVHDIRSPVATLSMMLKFHEQDIPEQVRVPLVDAAMNISDIANNFLNRYENRDPDFLKAEERRPIIVALILSRILGDKKYQYKEKNIKFTDGISPKCTFTFIKVQRSAFKRMISNLISNAVEALERKKGVIHLDLNLDGDNVKIVIQDSGKGMSQEVINKILHNVHVDTDKKEGHGIGLTQVSDALKNNQGKLSIESKLGEGTKMIVTFPTVETPGWLAKEVKVNKGDTVVVLDDDRSIHGAWDVRFKNHLNEITVRHFMVGKEAIDFINSFPEKEKIFLLTDFELLKQNLDGIDVIEQTKVKKTVLVTSHYAEDSIRNRAIKVGVRVLPKQSASEIPIVICEAETVCVKAKKSKAIDIVIIDDNQAFVASMELLFDNYNKTVDKYSNPTQLLDNMSKYDKNTKVFIDNDFGVDYMNGVVLAKRLHDNGFMNLYLLSGTKFEEGAIPEYLTGVLKSDIDSLCKVVE